MYESIVLATLNIFAAEDSSSTVSTIVPGLKEAFKTPLFVNGLAIPHTLSSTFVTKIRVRDLFQSIYKRHKRLKL